MISGSADLPPRLVGASFTSSGAAVSVSKNTKPSLFSFYFDGTRIDVLNYRLTEELKPVCVWCHIVHYLYSNDNMFNAT
jgi:hypothetical protein